MLTRSSLPVIDAHNHVRFWLKTGRTVEDLLRLMDGLQIESMVNIAGLKDDDPYESFGLTERAHPDRFITVAALNLSDPDAPGFAGTLRRDMLRMRERGFHGVKVWKNLGLTIRGRDGRLIAPDDERLLPVWRTAAELGLPVFMHLADPAAFFTPVDEHNERYEELLAHPDWSFHGGDFPRLQDLLQAQERILAREKETVFILAHVGTSAENMAYAGSLLDRYPNAHFDLSARFAELGRQPYTARDFCLRYQDRLLYGLDDLPARECYLPTFRLLETMDEYFPYSPHDPPPQGRWLIYGLGLPAPVLEKIYRGNALRLLKGA